MSKPTPAQAEATGASVEFEFDGETYFVAPSSEWDLDVLENMEDGLLTKAVRALLGPADYARFRAKKRTVADLENLMAAIESALGVPGN